MGSSPDQRLSDDRLFFDERFDGAARRAQDHYTERLIRLPNLGGYYDPFDDACGFTQPEPNLACDRQPAVYWCGQSLFKYLPQFDQVFPRIAREVGDCQFVFIQLSNGP